MISCSLWTSAYNFFCVCVCFWDSSALLGGQFSVTIRVRESGCLFWWWSAYLSEWRWMDAWNNRRRRRAFGNCCCEDKALLTLRIYRIKNLPYFLSLIVIWCKNVCFFPACSSDQLRVSDYANICTSYSTECVGPVQVSPCSATLCLVHLCCLSTCLRLILRLTDDGIQLCCKFILLLFCDSNWHDRRD